jgi:hypothetical protein
VRPTYCYGKQRQHNEFLYGNPSVNSSPGRTRKEQDKNNNVYLRDMERGGGVMELVLNHGFVVRSVKFAGATATHLVVYTGICIEIFQINVLSPTTVICVFSS